jgi:hypothetical protein
MVLFLFFISPLQTNTFALNIRTSVESDVHNNKDILLDIENTEGKILLFDEVIGDVHVRYWEHIKDDVLIKNDSMLLHQDSETAYIIKYRKSWTDIDFKLDFENIMVESDIIIKKQMVVFPEKCDCGFFYNFYEDQNYPILCWEIWYNNGETILYDISGKKMGYGIPTPNSGFSLSGYDYNPGYPDDPWIGYRKNANKYFQDWCTTNESISLPLKDEVSAYVQDPSVHLFYEIAHGDHISFLLNKQWERYYFSTARKDMENRPPMKFAFIGSCKGMNQIGPDSLSYEFRKGQMEDTVTVGYCNMTQSAWEYAYEWQDFMFKLIDKKEKIYDAFIQACTEYPVISNNVVFVGDKNLTVIPKPRYDYIDRISNTFIFSLFERFPLLIILFSIKI